MTRLNGDAFADPRVRVVRADPLAWLRATAPRERDRYDVVVCDLPGPALDPDAYSLEFYGLLVRALPSTARLAVVAGRPGPTLWTLDATLRAAGWQTRPYRDAGTAFDLAAHRPPSLHTPGAVPLPPAPRVPPSTLLRPRYRG